MKLLTDGKFIYMFSKSEIQKAAFPDDICDLDSDMVWSFRYPNIQTLAQIQEKWPHIFAIDNPNYIPNLKFVNFDIDAYADAIKKHNESEPKCGDFITEITGIHIFMAKVIS